MNPNKTQFIFISFLGCCSSPIAVTSWYLSQCHLIIKPKYAFSQSMCHPIEQTGFRRSFRNQQLDLASYLEVNSVPSSAPRAPLRKVKSA